MITDDGQKNEILDTIPAIARSAAAFQDEFFSTVAIAHVPPNHPVCMEGEQCTSLALVLSGKVRVYKVAESGREITLYRITPGESCILTASCILSRVSFPALAVTETDVKAVLVPAKQTSDWMGLSAQWRNFVFSLVAKRMADIISLLDQVAFQRMDVRIAAHLLKLPRENRLIKTTHYEIAAELGTAREVISRTLKILEDAGLIRVEKGLIHVLDQTGLETKAHHLSKTW